MGYADNEERGDEGMSGAVGRAAGEGAGAGISKGVGAGTGKEADKSVGKDGKGALKTPLPDRRELTPIQTELLEWIVEQTAKDGGVVASKAQLAELLMCNEKTVERAMSRLRREGLVATEARYDERRAQLANAIRATSVPD